MKTNPLFTVITCTYNRTKFLDECLNSVKDQTFKDFEHIIVDGYSTDGTYEQVLEYKKQIKDYPVKIIQSEAKGISNAFNVGIRNSNGKYLLFINSDDYLHDSDVLQRCSQILGKRQDILWLQGNSGFEMQNKKIFLNAKYFLKPTYLLQISIVCPVSHQSSVMRRDIFKKYGEFDEGMRNNMDTELFFRLLGKVDIYFANINIAVFRVHKDSLSVQIGPFQRQTWKYMNRRYKNIPFFSGIGYYFAKNYLKRLKSI